MTIEAYTDGKTMLFRTPRRPTPPIGGLTPLPPDAPAAYARSQLGEKTLAYMDARGWIDRRYVARLAEQQKEGA